MYRVKDTLGRDVSSTLSTQGRDTLGREVYSNPSTHGKMYLAANLLYSWQVWKEILRQEVHSTPSTHGEIDSTGMYLLLRARQIHSAGKYIVLLARMGRDVWPGIY